MKFILPCFLLLALGAPSVALAQHDVGNGGDPLMLIFTKAKLDAAHMLEVVAASGMPTTVDQKVRDFLAAHRGELAGNVKASKHIWHDEDTDMPPGFDRCAVTNVPATAANPEGALSDIHLSLARCRTILLATTAGESEAVRILIHEAAHHFDVGGSDSEEEFASLFALAVYNTWLAQRTAGAPHWEDTALLDAPEARYLHTAVWTGPSGGDGADQVLVWGGCNYSTLPNKEDCAHYLNDGGSLAIVRGGSDGSAPTTTWRPLDQTTAPVGRILHTAVWTGAAAFAPARDKMIIFGGCRGDDVACSQSFAVSACEGGGAACSTANRDNIIYDAAADRWLPGPTADAPSPRVLHASVWTGSEMLVWGGLEGYKNGSVPDRALNDGAALRFTPEHPGGVWEPMRITAETPAPRYGASALWTGHYMLVWGGCELPGITRCTRYYGDGGLYDPQTGTWEKIPESPFVEPRADHSAVLTGRYLIVWGGRNARGTLNSGGIFDLETRRWLPTSMLLPRGEIGRYGHSAVWDGLRGRMLIWGGQRGNDEFPTETLVFEPTVGAAGRWSLAPTDVSPIGRKGQTTLWINDALLVWGGFGEDDTFLYTGGLFNP